MQDYLRSTRLWTLGWVAVFMGFIFVLARIHGAPGAERAENIPLANESALASITTSPAQAASLPFTTARAVLLYLAGDPLANIQQYPEVCVEAGPHRTRCVKTVDFYHWMTETGELRDGDRVVPY